MVNQHKNRKIKMVVHMESDEKKKKCWSWSPSMQLQLDVTLAYPLVIDVGPQASHNIEYCVCIKKTIFKKKKEKNNISSK